MLFWERRCFPSCIPKNQDFLSLQDFELGLHLDHTVGQQLALRGTGRG